MRSAAAMDMVVGAAKGTRGRRDSRVAKTILHVLELFFDVKTVDQDAAGAMAVEAGAVEAALGLMAAQHTSSEVVDEGATLLEMMRQSAALKSTGAAMRARCVTVRAAVEALSEAGARGRFSRAPTVLQPARGLLELCEAASGVSRRMGTVDGANAKCSAGNSYELCVCCFAEE